MYDFFAITSKRIYIVLDALEEHSGCDILTRHLLYCDSSSPLRRRLYHYSSML
jgi:hypothetical protein